MSSPLPAAEFIENGRRYVVRDPHFLERADSHLFNDGLEVQMDLRGKCRSRFLQPNGTPYSEALRAFYLRDEATGKFWSVPYDPVQIEPDSFEFSAGTADIQWRVVVDGIEVWLRLVVPREDQVELWTVTVTNRGAGPRKLSLYSYFPIGQVGWINQSSSYDPALGGIVVDYFPYYVKVADYYKLRTLKNSIFCASDRKPVAFETNQREFLGGKGPHDPAALHLPKLAGGKTAYEPSVAALQYKLSLAPQAAATTNFAFGPAVDHADIKRLVKTYLRPGAVEQSLAGVRAFQESISPAVRISTPDSDFDAFVNNWLPHQTHFCGALLRMDGEVCVRNAFQDSMGATFNMPDRARATFCKVFAHQNADGYMPHGAALVEGTSTHPINTIPHRDMNVWAPFVLSFYAMETGDVSILDENVGFRDSKEKATIHEHICRGLEWQLRDRTKRRLCRIGEGDWDDPLNMAGWKEKGESIWLTEALAVALDTWAVVANRIGDRKRAKVYRREADVCRKAINDLAWDGEWYARGTTDAGRWFGVSKDKEGKIFLNAQSWALMSNAATGRERIEACMKAVRQHLMTPSGPMTMAPAFTTMHEDIGKITQKTPGTGENGSVYCHAASFYAYGLFHVRQAEEGFRILRTLLTGAGTNPLTRSQQLPLYIPNFYRGSAAGKTAGRSSAAWNTGTAAWFYRTAVTDLLGVRGEFDGLRIDPQLPRKWDKVEVWRKFRGAEFNIAMRKTRGVRKIEVILDGKPLPGNLIPIQKPGGVHTVEVRLPAASAAA